MSAVTSTPDPSADGHSVSDRLGLGRAQVANRMVDVNDGIIATGGIVEGFSSAGVSGSTIVLAALAALVAGAIALGGAKYAEAASEQDVERAILEEEERLITLSPDEELAELEELYRAKGLTQETAARVAAELSATDALLAHAEAEYGIDPSGANPLSIALGSGVSFAAGALLPLLAVLLLPTQWEGAVLYVAALLALCGTAWLIARIGRASFRRTVARSVTVGGVALGVSWLGGHLFG